MTGFPLKVYQMTPFPMKDLQALLQNVDELLNEPGAPPPVSIDDSQVKAPDELLAALNKYFGYADFRDGQREVVEKILDGENILASFPTGYGKSLCYQLPALMLHVLSAGPAA